MKPAQWKLYRARRKQWPLIAGMLTLETSSAQRISLYWREKRSELTTRSHGQHWKRACTAQVWTQWEVQVCSPRLRLERARPHARTRFRVSQPLLISVNCSDVWVVPPTCSLPLHHERVSAQCHSARLMIYLADSDDTPSVGCGLIELVLWESGGSEWWKRLMKSRYGWFIDW